MIHLTGHSVKQARKRFKWNRSALERVAERAYEEGLTYSDTCGNLRIYFDQKRREESTISDMRVYGDNLWLFNEVGQNIVLVSLYRLPTGLQNLTRALHNKNK